MGPAAKIRSFLATNYKTRRKFGYDRLTRRKIFLGHFRSRPPRPTPLTAQVLIFFSGHRRPENCGRGMKKSHNKSWAGVRFLQNSTRPRFVSRNSKWKFAAYLPNYKGPHDLVLEWRKPAQVSEACPQVAAQSRPLVTPELSTGMDFWPRLDTRIHFINLFADPRKFERKLQPLCIFFGRFYRIFS